MENTKNTVVVGFDADWHDVGSWKSLRDNQADDANGNVITGDVVAVKTENSYIRSSDRLVVASGLDNQIVRDTKDALLVTNTSSEQQLVTVVEELKVTHNQQTIDHQEVQRPCGTYDSVDVGDIIKSRGLRSNPVHA